MKLKTIVYGTLLLAVACCIPSMKDKTTSIMQSISIQNEQSSYTSLSTTSEDSSNVIVIDAGHGGYDSGSISEDGIYEKDITLAIAYQVGTLLQEAGYDVVYTRTSDDVSWKSDNKADLQARVQIAENANAAYFISIHTNASDNFDDGAYGIETYIDYRNAIITKMANQIQDNLTSLGYSYDRGVKSTQDGSLYVIDQNDVPAMLIEIGFITDSEEAAYMASSVGQNNIAQAIADGICASR